MEDEQKMLERITELEQELTKLRSEVHQLKAHVKFEPVSPISKGVAPTILQPKQPEQNKITGQNKQTVAVEPPIESTVTAPKEKRSLEELFTRALPRIFMVILVLGVLWGLKLVSDYGFLSDSIKVIAGFALSIGLASFAYMMEKKQKGSRVVALSLYGGAFIVGILSTAAGAILYDVLSLTVALVFAVIYIVYGVLISYIKGNEALTVLVVFTSLLLPYLLEYMHFNAVIIGIFIVLLFAGVQIVILKHVQRKALYIGTVFSILALAIVSISHRGHMVFFATATLLVYSIFLVSYLHIISSKSKFNASLLFSLTIVILTVLNMMLWQKDAMLLVLLITMVGVLGGALYIVFKRKDRLLIDMFATLATVTLLNIVAQLNISREVTFLLLIIVAFAGILLGVKHAIPFMKWVQGFTFSMLTLYVLVFYSVQPFFSMEHVTLVLVIAMLAALYYVLLHYKHEPIDEQKWDFGLEDVYPCLLYAVALLYVWKLDAAYMPMQFTSYLLLGSVALGFVGTLVANSKLTGQFLPFVAAGIYGYTWLILLMSVWVDQRAVVVALLIRILYMVIFGAIVADLWKRGRIYKNHEKLLAPYTEQLTITGAIVSIVWLFNLTHFMNFHELINWSTAVILNTVSIFTIACLSLFLSAKRNYRQLKLVGIGLLFFGIIKMIFFDLSELDILIRSISFILIGAIGLVISNKLLGKEKEQ